MVRFKYILLFAFISFVFSCDTGFDIIIVNDSTETILICRYAGYYAGNFNNNKTELIQIEPGKYCIFSPFGPLDPYMLKREHIESILTSSIIYIESSTRRYYVEDWKKNIDAVYDSVNKNWLVKLSDIINF